jgi:YidC/Oxa1 family membrane protein insertase
VNFLREIWAGLMTALEAALRFFHGALEGVPLLGVWSWGLAIVALTVVVRVLLLPLAIKQIRSMRGMQQLQPEIKRIQKKYKADRQLMKTDPEKFKARRQKQQEEMMKLYREHNVNPMGSCLPLGAQMPIFIGMFWLLGGRPGSPPRVPEMADADFLLVSDLTTTAWSAGATELGAWVFVILMGVTTYVSQRQMMANNPATADNPQMKIMLYAMPVFLTVIAVNFPVGMVLYWVTTNLWTMGQQWFMFRNIEPPGKTAEAKT